MKKIIPTLFFTFFISVGFSQSAADSMLQFFTAHTKTCSVYALNNNRLIGALNESEVMPIASMWDLLVAMEFAKQAAFKLIDTAEPVNLKEIVKYYLETEKTDSYENWLADMLVQKKIRNNTISLMEVVRGMLQYGALANTEFLMDKLGFDNIKSSIKSYNLTDHTAVLPPVGALAVYQNRTKTSEKSMLRAIENMNEEAYCKAAFLMHLAIKSDSSFKLKITKKISDEKILKMWSNRLPQASTSTYGNLMRSLLDEKLADTAYYKMMRLVLEWPMQNPAVNSKYNRFFIKGSTTTDVFSQAQYVKGTGGADKILVYTCTALKPAEMLQLNRWHGQFDNQVFTDPAFQKKLSMLKTPVKKKKILDRIF
jgi:D-alanyl-D-alanine carboxypeptidase